MTDYDKMSISCNMGDIVLKKVIFFAVLCIMLGLINHPNAALAVSKEQELQQNIKDSINRGSWTNAAIYSKQLAVYYDERKEYDKAAVQYDNSAIYWSKAGHADWGIQNTIRADHIRTELELYVEKPIPLNKLLAKFEPLSGTYLGLFLAGWRENASPYPVKDIYGRNHAIYLTYTRWGKVYEDTNSYFPLTFAKEAKENGSGIQIGWEPLNGLDEVNDDEYVRQFAREAKQSGVPVFLRFAGEMNGEWVPWSGDPKKYIEKYRLISKIMREEAPNVAMVWSPNFLPRHNIDQYYPGDDVVDWVGMSLYTIPYSHGEEVLGGNPIDYLKPLYEKYSYKPMMVSEGAVSHYSYEQNKDYSVWAAGQLGNMYGFLPRMFPQIKAISYFNYDKLGTTYDNANNNYDLGDSKIADNAYQKFIKDSYIMDHLSLDEGNNKSIQTQFVPYKNIKQATNNQNVFVYAKLPLGQQPYYVAVYQGNVKLAESYSQPWNMKVDFSRVNSKQPLTLIAFDKNFKRVATKNVSSNFQFVNKLGKFTDVSDKHWAFDLIEKAEADGITKGYEDGSFRPNQKVTVAEFVTMLGRVYGKGSELENAGYPQGTINLMNVLNYPYGDKSNQPITRKEVAEIISGSQGQNLTGDESIMYLLTKGLAKGKNPDKVSIEDYKGQETLTRAEAVSFIDNVKNKGVQEILARPGQPTDAAWIKTEFRKTFNIPAFKDVPSTHWAFADVEQAEKDGLVKGYPDGSFLPNQKVTVAEFVTMLGRIYGSNIDGVPYPQGTIDLMTNMNYPYREKGGIPITRKEAAEIISGTQGQNLAGDDAIMYLLINGLSQGTDQNQISVENYKGESNLTRAEAVTFIANVKKVGVPTIQARPTEPTNPEPIRAEYDQKY